MLAFVWDITLLFEIIICTRCKNIPLQVDKDGQKGYYNNIMNETVKNNLKITMLRDNADMNNGIAVAVGNFDGVHIGHRAMLSALTDEAKRLGVPAAVFTFDIGNNPKQSKKLIADENEKKRLLAENGVDVVFSVPFSVIKDMSAQSFAEELLADELGAKSAVCGYDFRFGYNRSGDAALMTELLSKRGVSVITPDAVKADGVTVSSTYIRELLSNGEIAEANKLLGRSYSFEEKVVHGKELGRQLGFPTINQSFPDILAPLRFGVYAVRCFVAGKCFYGVANLGIKPTVTDDGAVVCETYLFDFSGDCYGETVKTEFLEFIRSEKRFETLGQLKQQVDIDKETARTIIQRSAFQ